MPASIFDRIIAPPVAALLGWRFMSWDAAAACLRLEFTAGPDFLNPAGFVQGGMLAAMLDDTMSSTVLAAADGQKYPATIDLNVAFLSAARPGRLHGVGEVIQMGKSIAFLAARIEDEGGKIHARATASARLMDGVYQTRKA